MDWAIAAGYIAYGKRVLETEWSTDDDSLTKLHHLPKEIQLTHFILVVLSDWLVQ